MLSTPARIGNIETSSLLLVLVNCIPLAGVLFFGWNVFEMVFLYWMESAIIAFSTIALLALMPISIADREGVPVNQKLVAIPFFILHFSGFMAGHLFLIIFFLGQSHKGGMLAQATEMLSQIPFVGWALLSLFISHAYSFFTNYILTKKYLQPLDKQSFWPIMTKPYRRIFLMQLVILIGACAVILFGLPESMLAVFVVVKIFFDLKAHKTEHAQKNNDLVSL